MHKPLLQWARKLLYIKTPHLPASEELKLNSSTVFIYLLMQWLNVNVDLKNHSIRVAKLSFVNSKTCCASSACHYTQNTQMAKEFQFRSQQLLLQTCRNNTVYSSTWRSHQTSTTTYNNQRAYYYATNNSHGTSS